MELWVRPDQPQEPGEIWTGYLVWHRSHPQFFLTNHLYLLHTDPKPGDGLTFRAANEKPDNWRTEHVLDVYTVDESPWLTFFLTNKKGNKHWHWGSVIKAVVFLLDLNAWKEEDTHITAGGCFCRLVTLTTPTPFQLIEALSAENNK